MKAFAVFDDGGGPALLFENPKGYSTPVLANLFGTELRVALGMGAQDLTALLDRFVELHHLSEGPKGVFMVPGMEIFFRRLGEAFGPPGIFRLTFIEVGGVKAAGARGGRIELGDAGHRVLLLAERGGVVVWR